MIKRSLLFYSRQTVAYHRAMASTAACFPFQNLFRGDSFCPTSSVHSLASASPYVEPRRSIFADKVRAGIILKIDKRHYRVVGSTRSQKGQNAASFNVKLVEVGTGRKKEVTAAQGHDFEETRAERVRLLFSGFDDDDQACFVYPEHSEQAGTEVNIQGDSLPDLAQQFLCCGMPVDVLHILPDEESNTEEKWCEVMMPSSYNYTVEQINMKGLYKMAVLKECDGVVSVNDTVQIGEVIKVILKPDGTASFGGRANS